MIFDPYSFLLKYQKDWCSDKSRFKIWNKARQIGGSFACAFEIVEDCVSNDRCEWIVLSASEDLAREFLRRCELCLDIWLPVYEDTNKRRLVADVGLTKIEFGNKSRIITLPANPRTARSFSGNVLLDEFAHHQDSEAIWAAIFPAATSAFHQGLKVRVVSTPSGKTNMFYKLFSEDMSFSRHRVTIHEAKAQGYDINVEEVRSKFLTEKHWRQEYECEFIDTDAYEAIIPRASIDRCNANPPHRLNGERAAYIDFGGGAAETVIARMSGNVVEQLIAFTEDNAYATAGKIIHECSTWNIKPSCVFGDYGYGKQIMDFMAEMGWPINPVNNGEAATEDIFANKGSQMWYDAKKRIERCDIILPKDEILFEQLTNRGVRYTIGGKIGLEKKEDMAKRGVKSPDRADAVCGVIFNYKFVQHNLNAANFFNSRSHKPIDSERRKLMRGSFAGS